MRNTVIRLAAFAAALAVATGCDDGPKTSIPKVDPNATPPKLMPAGSGDAGAKKKQPGGSATQD